MKTSVSMNISGCHFQQPGFSRRLASLLSSYPLIRPQQLELEVLETSALEDITLVLRVIQDCQALGVSVSLDDVEDLAIVEGVNGLCQAFFGQFPSA
ncbi:MAG: EAL domain-containing protein [Candidatus Thiodiazotropha sp.]